jgi:hypothetical protein
MSGLAKRTSGLASVEYATLSSEEKREIKLSVYSLLHIWKQTNLLLP